jgi:uncharacterized protein YbaP (TraB family)
MPRGILYKIKKNGKSSYLFGTIRSGVPKINQLSMQAKYALEHADRVVLDYIIPSNYMSVSREIFVEQALQPDKKPTSSFSTYLKDQNCYDQFVQMLKLQQELQQPYERFSDRLLNERIETTPPLMLLFDLSFSIRSDQFIDKSLVIKAKQMGKPVFALGSFKEYLTKLFALDLTREEQREVFLYIFLQRLRADFLDRYGRISGEKIKAYLQGDFILLSFLFSTAGSLHLPSETEVENCPPVFKKWDDFFLKQRAISMADAMQPHLTEGNAFFAVHSGHLAGIIDNLLNSGYTIEAVHEGRRLFSIQNFSYRHIKHFIGMGLLSFFGLTGISLGLTTLGLGLSLIAAAIIATQVLSGGIIALGAIFFCLVGVGAKLLIDKFQKEPKLPESLELKTTPVDTYTQLLTNYLLQHPTLINKEELKDVFVAAESPEHTAVRCELATHIDEGTGGLIQDHRFGNELLKQLPGPAIS